MILFLVAELMFFSGLASTYTVLRSGASTWKPEGLASLSSSLSMANTFLLFASAGSYFFATRALRREDPVFFRLHLSFTLLLALTFVGDATSTAAVVLIHLGWFFFAALLGHARLSEDRPEAGRLTEFYAWVSVGGATVPPWTRDDPITPAGARISGWLLASLLVYFPMSSPPRPGFHSEARW